MQKLAEICIRRPDSMREVRHNSLTLIVLAVMGCTNVPPTAETSRPIVVDRTLVYTGQHAKADVIAYFEGWNRMFPEKPEVSDGQSWLPLAKERFVHMLDALGVGRR